MIDGLAVIMSLSQYFLIRTILTRLKESKGKKPYREFDYSPKKQTKPPSWRLR